ncbi:MAG: hypothetical protein V4553_11905 [Bacteroidota bacterium]
MKIMAKPGVCWVLKSPFYSYGLLAYYFKISADINDKVEATFKKALRIIK